MSQSNSFSNIFTFSKNLEDEVEIKKDFKLDINKPLVSHIDQVLINPEKAVDNLNELVQTPENNKHILSYLFALKRIHGLKESRKILNQVLFRTQMRPLPSDPRCVEMLAEIQRFLDS